MVPMTDASIATEVYQAAGIRGCVHDAAPSNEHRIFKAADCRIAETWTVSPLFHEQHTLTGQKSPTGAIYYLPYQDDHIYSMRLPGNPPAGCRKFLTANLSGCRIYVDRILGSTDVIVYHANTHQHGSPIGSPANAQSNAASGILDALHNAARLDYAALNPSVNTIPAGALLKVDYMEPGEAETLRKRGQGRRAKVLQRNPVTNIDEPVDGDPQFQGGTTVCGFYNNGWEFYYQTWGLMEYERPGGKAEVAKLLLTGHWNTVHKLRVQGTRQTLQNTGPKVLHHEQFL